MFHLLVKNWVPLAAGSAWLLVTYSLVLLMQLVQGVPVSLPAWATMWDGGWYMSIVQHGYQTAPPTSQANVAFFPLLPVIIWVITTVTALPIAWVALAVSALCFMAALVVLYNIVLRLYDAKTATITVLLLVLNPFSFYFGMFYTESLFLLMTVLAFWFILQKQWWLAALFAGLATASRSVGVAVALVVCAAWLWQHRRAIHRPKVIAKGIAVATVSVSGIVLFSAYVWQHSGDAFAYMTAQRYWPGRGVLSNVPAEINFLFTSPINLEYLITAMWLVAAIVGLVGVLLLLRFGMYFMAIYSGISLILPIIFGTLTSVNRYVIVAFPVFIAFAILLRRMPVWVTVVALAFGLSGLTVMLWVLVDSRLPFLG